MARAIHKLSARGSEALTAVGRHSDGGGLYLSISANGGRRWVFYYKWQGKQREMGLGSAREITLKRARDLAADARKSISQGIDPLAKKAADAKAVELEAKAKPVPSFGEAADRLIESIEGEFRNKKHRDQWKMTLGDTYCASIRHTPTNELTTEDILGVLSPIWRPKQETASRIRGRIERVWDAAKARDPDKSRWTVNPALWRGNLEHVLGKRTKLQRGHHAAMPWREVPAFFQKARGFESSSQLALAFLISCASRSGEIIGAIWSEFDLAKKIWTIPAGRMKAGREHSVPLSDTALSILAEMAKIAPGDADRHSAFVFPGAKKGRPLSTMALTMRMRALNAGHFTAHGFRSSFRDWCGDATHFPRELAEHALAHIIGNAAEQAYRRSDALEKRREMMNAWAQFLTTEPH
ncbi:Integrase [Phyllobacterium sp. YR620]|uniref:tyrosine-type recombinase/integrase n=1 Tax=Phyllobacterium sp. YR620 TaxID=1881066 RepID=UPI00087E3E55|nr:site-specific integrase [Phyllobacterium sp. YR620]SDP55376.1 Integrase [Phyllobacterium sp. YR620]